MFRPFQTLPQWRVQTDPPGTLEATDFPALVDSLMVKAEPVPPSPEQARSEALANLRAETERTILARYPEHTQRNMLARGLALAAEGKADSDEAQELRAAWAWIEEQRAIYRQRKAELEA